MGLSSRIIRAISTASTAVAPLRRNAIAFLAALIEMMLDHPPMDQVLIADILLIASLKVLFLVFKAVKACSSMNKNCTLAIMSERVCHGEFLKRASADPLKSGGGQTALGSDRVKLASLKGRLPRWGLRGAIL